MEEQKKEEVQENPVEQITDPVKSPLPTRSYMLHVLAGLYLVYTGYRLCKNVMDGAEGASFGFMIAGIAFLLIGGFLAVNGVRGVSRRDKLEKEAQAKETEAQEIETGETAAPEQKMSIAERARLVSTREEDED